MIAPVRVMPEIAKLGILNIIHANPRLIRVVVLNSATDKVIGSASDVGKGRRWE